MRALGTGADGPARPATQGGRAPQGATRELVGRGPGRRQSIPRQRRGRSARPADPLRSGPLRATRSRSPCSTFSISPTAAARTTSSTWREIDVEGDRLWLVGSHTWTRGKPKDNPVRDLARVSANPNRHVLACLPLLPSAAAGGHGDLPTEPGAVPRGSRACRSAKRRGALPKALKKDPHLRPFLMLPSKENGFDVEGIAVLGQRVLLGLRGPVLRGVAIVLELHVEGPRDERARARAGRQLRRPATPSTSSTSATASATCTATAGTS